MTHTTKTAQIVKTRSHKADQANRGLHHKLRPSSRLAKVLAASPGERRISKFLKEHPQIIFWSFYYGGGHSAYVVPEFGLGKSLRCDFALIQTFSGGARVHFVELEPVKDGLFNKDRTPTRRLRVAQKQIADWQDYVHNDVHSLRLQLSQALTASSALVPAFGGKNSLKACSALLRDPKTYIYWNYSIVIGRRVDLSEANRELKARSSYQLNIQLVSYDRLLDVAKVLENPEQTLGQFNFLKP